MLGIQRFLNKPPLILTRRFNIIVIPATQPLASLELNVWLLMVKLAGNLTSLIIPMSLNRKKLILGMVPTSPVNPERAVSLPIQHMAGMPVNVTHLDVESHITVVMATSLLEDKQQIVKLMVHGRPRNFQHAFVSRNPSKKKKLFTN